ncbi:hypothetical protein Tsubulata_016775 [Turnera subulata]|uniref:Pentacotripeptide-repeat region of PRORP domain-containing protein n=1 Tax=Turnera subulata TaxID=218843 RepID=A0A9Q0J4C6_9ROSI|nr:hypothetical protein Tsubulata_016775 [Turnera subulata]
MYRARTFLARVKLANSFLSTRISPARPLLTQVTHFSPNSLSNFELHLPFYVNAHQKLYFSSQPNSVGSIIEIIRSGDWSAELENELENSNSVLTHETVIYVLKKLDKDPEKAWGFFNWVSGKNWFRPSLTLYSLVLRIFANKGSMDKFWIVIRRMKEEGFYIDYETYTTILEIVRKERMANDVVALKHFYERLIQENGMDGIVKSVVDAIVKGDWNDEVEKKLKDMKVELSDNFVVSVLKGLRNYPEKALRFFQWVGGCEGFEHNSITYNAVARVLGREDSMREFWGIVEEMKSAGYEMDIDSYIKISRHFQKFKLTEDAVRLYEIMMDGPFKPSGVDSFMLLRSIAGSDKPDLDLVSRVTKRYEATGNALSKAYYDTIHRSFTSAQRFEEAEKIMNTMRNAGYKPDNITYSQLVFGLCKAGRLEEACKVLDEMEANGCIPDIKTWTILIKGHCDANEVDKALICFARMMEKDCSLDADLLDVLVNGFLNQKRIEGGYKLLEEMVNNTRVIPWQATYKLLIEKLLGARKLEEAMNLLQRMIKHGYPPYPEPFVPFISQFGTVIDAVDFFKALSVKQYPSLLAYLHIFQSFFKEGRHSEANDLLFKCPHHIRKHPKISKLFGSAKNADNMA